MLRVVTVLLLAISTTACGLKAPHSFQFGTEAPSRSQQWLAVLDLRATDAIRVVARNGASHEGQFLFASTDILRLGHAGGDVTLGREDVLQVFVRPVGWRSFIKNSAMGAVVTLAATSATVGFLCKAFSGEWCWDGASARAALVGAAAGAALTVTRMRERLIYSALPVPAGSTK